MRSRRTVTVKMPAGVSDGMGVRLASQGEVGPGGGPAGDLYVEVEEAPHDVFTREGVDLHCVLPLKYKVSESAKDLGPAVKAGTTETTTT